MAFLDLLHPVWADFRDGTTKGMLLGQFVVPTGYTVNATLVALRIEPAYPDTQIDMAYFFPALCRQDEKPIPATGTAEVIDGKTFQRWSRHRTAENPWRPGIDDVSTHLAQVQHWFLREFQK